jgi:hypothetical protein
MKKEDKQLINQDWEENPFTEEKIKQTKSKFGNLKQSLKSKLKMKVKIKSKLLHRKIM